MKLDPDAIADVLIAFDDRLKRQHETQMAIEARVARLEEIVGQIALRPKDELSTMFVGQCRTATFGPDGVLDALKIKLKD